MPVTECGFTPLDPGSLDSLDGDESTDASKSDKGPVLKDGDLMGFSEGMTRLMARLGTSDPASPPAIRGKRPALVIVAGGSCSGKSYLARQLKEQLELNGEAASIIPLDNYFRDIDDPELPRNAEGRRLFDASASYHQKEFTDDVLRLLSGRDIVLPDYDIPSNKILSPHGKLVRAGPVIIAEGLFAIGMLEGIAFRNVIKIYVDADENVRLQRRIERDTTRYGATEAKVRETFRLKVLPCHIQFVAPQRQLADLVIWS